MKNFKTLKVWQEAINLAELVYKLTEKYAADERYNLISQSRRSAVSIAANIAEGCGFDTDAQLNRFLQIAQGSAFELETHLLLAQRLHLILKDADFSVVLDKVDFVQKLIYNFQKTLKL